MPATLVVQKPYLLGLVLGDAQDRAALVVLDRVPGATQDTPVSIRLGHVQRWPLGTPYPVVLRAVDVWLTGRPLKGETGGLVVDATGAGRPFVDVLTRSAITVPVLPVMVTAGGRVWGDEMGWHVPLRDLVASIDLLLQAKRLVMAEELAEATALRSDLRRFLARGADGDVAGYVAKVDALVLAVALTCWWGAIIQPAQVDLVPGDFSAFSAEARQYEINKRRVKSGPPKQTGPSIDSIA
jgi:hypothetical protein